MEGRSVILEVKRAYVDEIWNYKLRKNEPKIVLDFGRTKLIILSPTQARAVEGVAGTGRFDQWPGVKIMLTAVPVANGRETIQVTAPPEPPEER